MKIKHWQGYGTVTAKKIGTGPFYDNRYLRIQVSGDHEYGLYRDDKYDIFKWLVKRFDKKAKDWTDIVDMQITNVPGQKEETVLYHIILKGE